MKYFLIFLAIIATFGLFSGASEPVITPLKGTWVEPILQSLHIGNSILFNLCVAYLGSFFFWALVVQYPEAKRRKLLRDNLSQQYQQFKESVIQVLLWSSVGGHDTQLPKKLCDHVEFRTYFDANDKQRWYDVLNGLNNRNDFLQDLLFEMELLASEVNYVLNNVAIQDARVHQSFKLLNENINRLKNSSVYTDDPVKYVGNFLWGILARWSFIDGQQQDDFLELMIKKV
ncbi:hypothetical protein [Methylophaga sp.]|uniref:hypothetical protein n=1 Tax=Methylophaga sp. TaxID=2024840 RepID=UPI0027203885|nr:hypothetical protein [Methylophaga sp.]MDO8827207.1 hypothetical protein [Methylophaga sp.]